MTMKVLLCILLGVLPAFAFPTPEAGVPPECIDPTFACQDLQSAKLCKVVSTCIHDVWETMSVPDSNDEICDICKEMVKEARDQLLSNMTQEEIKEVFEGSCKLLPIKIIAEGCIKIVDEIIPQLVEMLASRMDPTMVCTVSGMCFPSKNDMEVEKHILKFVRDHFLRQKDDQCAECTQMMTDVQAFMKSSSEAQCKTYVEKLCHEKMPSYLCNIVLNTYFKEIYNFILTTEPTKLCSSVGICPQKCELKNEVASEKLEDELTCEFCEHLLQHVKDLITSNTTLEEFKTALLNFCKQTGKWADKCTNLVNDYYDMLFNYIKQLDTRGMCTLMGLCNNTGCAQLIKVVPDREAHRRIPLIKLQPAQTIFRPQPLVRLIPAEMISKKQMKDSNDVFQLPLDKLTLPLLQRDTECALCRAFSFYLEKDLAGENSKVGVREAINGVCEKWMVEYPDHCKHLVETYSLKMQMAIAKGISFDSLCSEVKACPLEESKKDELNVKVIPKVGDGPFCNLCKDAMNEVEKALSDPATKQKLKDELDQVCNFLPKSFRDDCVSFVNQNIDALIAILQQELNPDQICPALRLCGSQKMIGVPPRVKDLECDVCKDVVTSFRKKLQDPASKEIIQTFLEEACRRLPLADDCKKFVDDNIDTVIKMIIEEMDPQKVCTILKICPASVPLDEPQDVECDLCKQVVGKVEDLIKDEKTEDAIKSALDKVCSYLPSSWSTKCENFVNQYTDLIVTLLMQELDPNLVCVELGVCPSSLLLEKPKETVKDVECDLCKQVVGKVEDMVKDKKTEDEIKKALDKVCSYLPSSMSTKCQNFVNKYTETIVTLLMEELDPETVCVELDLCPSQIKEEKPKELKDADCDLCKAIVGKIEEIVKDKKTEDEIKEALDKVCSLLPSEMATKCEAFVNEYALVVIDLITQGVSPGLLCAIIEKCPVDGIECEACHYSLHYIQEELMDNETQGRLKEYVKHLCTIFLPQSLAGNCQAFVDEYGSSLFVLVAQEIDPNAMCFKSGMCKANTTLSKLVIDAKIKEKPKELKDADCDLCKEVVGKIDEIVKDKTSADDIRKALEKVCSLLPSSKATKCEAFVIEYSIVVFDLISQGVSPSLLCAIIEKCTEEPGSLQWKSKVDGIECEACHYSLHYIQEELMDNETQGRLKEYVKHLCTIFLPQSLAGNCQAFVDEYGISLFVLVAQEIDPNAMCFKSGMCKANATLSKLVIDAKIKEEKPKEIKDADCDLCKEVVGKIDDIVKDKTSADDIRKALEKVCSLLPASEATKCEAFVIEYSIVVFDLVSQGVSPSLLCAIIEKCTVDGIECEACHYSLHFIQAELMNIESLGRLEEYVKHMCTVFLPQTLAGKCQAFVHKYSNSLFALVAQEIDPNRMCYKAGMCKTNATLSQLVTDVAVPNLSHFQIDECSVCTTVVDYMDKLLEEDDVDKEITKLVEKVCVVLPASYRGKCQSMLEAYGPYILQMIGQVANSKELCQDIDLCARPAGHVHLIGGSKCTFGPSYWCHSAAHATACKAESYCQSKGLLN